MSAIGSIRKSIKTLSARFDAAGGVLSYSFLAAAAAACVWLAFTVVLPNLELHDAAERRLDTLRLEVELQKDEARKSDDQIRAMDSPYEVAIIARQLGFVKPEPPPPTTATKRSATSRRG